MSLLADIRRDRPQTREEAARTTAKALESMVLKQLVASSGLFKSAQGASAGWTADLFADALADAVTASGVTGLSSTIAGGLPGGTRPAPPAPPSSPAPIPFSAPAAPLAPIANGAGHVTSSFGARRDPFTGLEKVHRGVDVGAEEGTPIHATLGGEVIQAGPRGGYGNAVEVDHGDGLHTLYAHASRVDVVPGQKVSAGQILGEVGQTGHATGAHLHFELRRGGHAIDPGEVLKVYRRRAEEESGGTVSPGGAS